MTIADLLPKVQYMEDGTTLNFPVPFRFFDPADVIALRMVDGISGALAYGADYSVTGGETDAGGTLTLTNTVAGATLTLKRKTPITQESDYQTGDNFPSETAEGDWDKAIAILQEQADELGRTVKVPDGEDGFELPAADDRAGYYFAFDADGNPTLASGSGADGALRTDLAQPTGGALVGFEQLGAGAEPEAIDNAVRRRLSALQFMTAAEKAAIAVFNRAAPSQAAGFSDAIWSAINAGEARRAIDLPSGVIVGPIQWPYAGAGDTRGGGFTMRGAAPPGEVFVASNLQKGTIFYSGDATQPTLKFNQPGANQGSGQLDVGNFRVEGNHNANVPALQFVTLYNASHASDITVYQAGQGDGVYVDMMAGGTIERGSAIGPNWVNPSGAKYGVGWRFRAPINMGLQEARKLQSKGFITAYEIGVAASAGRLLAPRILHSESSNCTNGYVVGSQCIGLTIDTPYLEGVVNAFQIDGTATCILNCWAPLITTGMTQSANALGTTMLGGTISIAPTANAYAVSITGTRPSFFMLGTRLVNPTFATAYGSNLLKIAGSDPKGLIAPDIEQDFTWASGDVPIVDTSNATGYGLADGSGFRGLTLFQSPDGMFFPRIGRGAYGRHIPTTVITEAMVSGTTLTLPAGSYFTVTFSVVTMVDKIVAPDFPGKWFTIHDTNGNVRFRQGTYYKMIENPTVGAVRQGPSSGILYELQAIPGVGVTREIRRTPLGNRVYLNNASATAAWPNPTPLDTVFMSAVNRQAVWSGANWYYGDGTIAA